MEQAWLDLSSPWDQAATGSERYTPTLAVPYTSTTAARNPSHRSCRVSARLANHFERTSTTSSRSNESKGPRDRKLMWTSPG